MKQSFSLPLSLVCCLVGSSLRFSPALAQVIPDGTTSTTVNADGNNFTIQNGDKAGSNLFHSFSEFNIGGLERVDFANPTGIERIFSRVTGNNISNIDGVLGVLGNADLFLLNPNGIVFGQNASLDVNGSFIASTADSIVFGDEFSFSASNPTDVPPLLTVDIIPGLQYGVNNSPSVIINSGNLAVGDRQRLTLAGKQVTSTGSLSAPGGTVELLGTESVAILENATIDVSFPTGGGTVLIGGNFQGQGILPNAKRTYVGNNVDIRADALNNGNGGKVIVWADEVTGFYGNISAKGRLESGNGGLVEISGKEHLVFRGNVDTSATNGLPGTLLLDPTNITIADGSGDELGDGTNSFGGNNAGVEGSILSTPLSEIDDIAPTTIYESELEGLSGDTNIILQATNNITLQDLTDDSLELAAGEGVIAFSADADGDGVGDFVMEDNVADTIFTNGRNLAISGANLTIGGIDTSLLVVGDAGELTETAQFVSDSPGETALETISGNISSFKDVDLFQIYLTGEGTFSASTVNPETTLRTQLFLFDAEGLGVYANYRQAGCDCIQSTLPAGDTLTPTEPGVYYLGISTFEDNAVSSGGEIFPSSFEAGSDAIRSPTGDGGLLPLSGWIRGSAQGSYTINLTGVEATEATIVESIQPKKDSGSITLNATGDINFNGIVDTSGDLGDGGAIDVTAKSVFVANDVRISSGINRKGNGGDINITATESITLSGESSREFSSGIGTRVEIGAEGTAGDININTGSLFLGERTGLLTNTFGLGNAGAITITATDTITLSGSIIRSQVEPIAQGNAGDITIDTASFSLTNGSQLSAGTFGLGDAGAITITATESINLLGKSSQGFPSRISSQVREIEGQRAEGNSRGIIINTDSLSLTDGAFISANTEGEGKAGNIVIKANTLQTTNRGQIQTNTTTNFDAANITLEIRDNLFLSGKDSGLFAQTEGAGDAGDINITANNFHLAEGTTVITNTASSGQAGEIKLQIRDNLNLVNSNITASTEPNSTGKGGSIKINPQVVNLTNSQIAVNSQGTGTGGDIELQADSLNLDNASISAETASNTGGDITLNVKDLLLLENQSNISTTAGTLEAGGDGGDITINSDVIVAFPEENNDITANAFNGSGGNININTEGIFGLEFRAEQTPFSDITASSEFGLDGTVAINTPDVNPEQGLINLPTTFATPSLDTSCQATNSANSSSFVNLGRGGLPKNPRQIRDNREVWDDLRSPIPNNLDDSHNSNLQSRTTKYNPIVEAQSWIVGDNGNIILVADMELQNNLNNSSNYCR